jgi:pimeloyl-ACP methyl ester carboxylesterase
VLSLHGAMGGYDQGVLLAETVLRPRFKCVAISRPGYLATPLNVGPTAQEQADLCADVLDDLNIEKVAVTAISGGGPTALQFALRHATRCSALVMISACSSRLDVPVPFRWNVMKLMARIPGMPARMRAGVERNPSKAMERAVPDTALRMRMMRDREAAELMSRLQKSVFVEMRRRFAGSDNDIRISRTDMSWPLEKIDAPLLVVHGTEDSIVPYQQAESLARRVPGAQLLSIRGGEHVSIFTHRAEVMARIDEFLGSIEGYAWATRPTHEMTSR